MSFGKTSLLSQGDIVAYDNPQAGKLKYHLCLSPCEGEIAACFLFINSGNRIYRDERVFDDGVFEGLPKSPTGKTVVSMTTIVRANQSQLNLFRARVICVCPQDVAKTLRTFSDTVRSLTKSDLLLVKRALAAISA